MIPKKFIILSVLLGASAWILAQPQTWIVPEEKKEVVAPFKFNNDSVKKGESVFLKNCQSCHGYPGRNNPAKITPSPGDPAEAKFQQQTDGEMFFRITTGKAPMPEFRNVLSETERWNVIAFLRSFNPKYIQPKPVQQAGMAGRTIHLKLAYIKDNNKIRIAAYEYTKEKKWVALGGAGIQLMVKRYFGYMQVDEIHNTNAAGIALFDFPAGLPGDKEGKVALKAVIHDDTGSMGEASVDTVMSLGVPTNVPSLIATRAWWTVRSEAPVWVILAYSFAVLIAWGCILYILYMLLFKMRKINKT